MAMVEGPTQAAVGHGEAGCPDNYLVDAILTVCFENSAPLQPGPGRSDP
jgi:hypothetical protein